MASPAETTIANLNGVFVMVRPPALVPRHRRLPDR